MIDEKWMKDQFSIVDIIPKVCGTTSRDYGPDVTTCYIINYVFSGSGTMGVWDKEYPLYNGCVCITRPNDVTWLRASQKNGWVLYWVGFETKIDLSILSDKPVIYAPGCVNIFQSIIQNDVSSTMSEFFFSGKILELLYLLTNTVTEKSQPNIYAIKAIQFIEDHYSEDINIHQIAEYLHINRNYLSRLLKQHTGQTAQEYLVNYRLERAAEFLQKGAFTPIDVFSKCGYKDIYNFSKQFSKKFGISPRNYIKRRKDI